MLNDPGSGRPLNKNKMKPGLLFLLAFQFIINGLCSGQDPHPGGDYFFLHKGGMYRVIVDMESRVMEEQHIATGLTVWPDGRFKTLNGKVKRLHEGEYLDPNGITYPNYAALRQEMKAHDMAAVRVRLELENGALIRCSDGTKEPVLADVKLGNGSMVTPVGLIRMKSGQTLQMHEGACLDLEIGRAHV